MFRVKDEDDGVKSYEEYIKKLTTPPSWPERSDKISESILKKRFGSNFIVEKDLLRQDHPILYEQLEFIGSPILSNYAECVLSNMLSTRKYRNTIERVQKMNILAGLISGPLLRSSRVIILKYLDNYYTQGMKETDEVRMLINYLDCLNLGAISYYCRNRFLTKYGGTKKRKKKYTKLNKRSTKIIKRFIQN